MDVDRVLRRKETIPVAAHAQRKKRPGGPMLFRFRKKDPDKQALLNRASEFERIEERCGEAESHGAIDILGQEMAALDSENREYHHRLLEQSRRLEELARIDAIQPLKRALLREAQQLRQTARAKESRETAKIEKLSRQVAVLERELQGVRSESERDSLTGICNRHAFDRRLDERLTRNALRAQPFALLMIDIDHFKRINEAYGYLAGDKVLATLVNKCRRSVRRRDLLARYGGEEIIILLEGASLRDAVKKSRQICESIASTRYVLEGMPAWEALTVTVSIGVSVWGEGDTAAALVGRADRALCAAKAAGRNRVVSQKDAA
jgi:diguanylate cyclase